MSFNKPADFEVKYMKLYQSLFLYKEKRVNRRWDGPR